MMIEEADLLPGEKIVLSKFANMIVSVKDSALSRFAFDDYMGLVGLHGQESIGGMAYVSNYRVIFKSHLLNRVRGKHSIFLPNINHACIASPENIPIPLPLFDKLKVQTGKQNFEFFIWGKQSMLDAVDLGRKSLNHDALKKAVLARPEAIGDGLKKCDIIEKVNQISLGFRSIQSVLDLLVETEKNDFLELLDLLKDIHEEALNSEPVVLHV